MQHAVARLKNGKPSVNFRVVCDASIHGLHVSRDCADLLTSYRSHTVEEPLATTIRGTYRLSPPSENPFLSDAAKRSLDETGLIRTQTVLEPDGVLASILHVHSGNDPTVGKAPTGMERVENESLDCDPDWVGMLVSSVEIIPPEKRGLKTYPSIRMQLEGLHSLEVGDALLLGTAVATVACVVDAPPAEIRVDPLLGRALGLGPGQSRAFDVFVTEATARTALAARATGYYSLITQMPLGRIHARGQVVSPAHIQTLRVHGLHHTLVELLTFKSTDVGNRTAIQRALAGEAPFPKPGAPFQLHILRTELMTLGFGTEALATGDHVSLVLSPMSDADRLTRSCGEVTKPETINYRTYNPEPNGLFCESIFGNEESPERSTRFGHVALVQPIVPFHWWERGPNSSPSFLAAYLGFHDDQLEKLVTYQEGITIKEDQELFEAMPQQGSAPTDAVSGANAISLLLARARQRNSSLPDISAAVIHKVVLVLPPDLRPLVLLRSGNFATSDLTDHYRRIINRNNRLRKLIELNAPDVIIRNEKRMLQQTVDGLFDNEACRRPVLGSANRPLRSIWDIVLSRIQKEALVRCDYSASAHAVPDPAQDPMTAGIPATILSTLGIAEGEPIFLTRPAPDDSSAPMAVLRAVSVGQHIITLPAAIHAGLFAGFSDLPVCVLHRPLTPEARNEIQRHVGVLLTAEVPAEIAWFSPGEVKPNVLMAALESAPLPFSSPRLMAVAGPGVTQPTPLPPRETKAPRWKDIPISTPIA